MQDYNTQKMIKIEKAKKEGLKPLLKMKALSQSEYVIISKTGEFDEPMTGESEFGKWFLYDITLHEYKTLDSETEAMKVYKPEENVSYFTGEKANIRKALEMASDKQKIKITMVENDKGKMIYNTELLDTATKSEEPKKDIPLAEFVQSMKKQGVDLANTITIAKNNYTTNDATIKALYEA